MIESIVVTDTIDCTTTVLHNDIIQRVELFDLAEDSFKFRKRKTKPENLIIEVSLVEPSEFLHGVYVLNSELVLSFHDEVCRLASRLVWRLVNVKSEEEGITTYQFITTAS